MGWKKRVSSSKLGVLKGAEEESQRMFWRWEVGTSLTPRNLPKKDRLGSFSLVFLEAPSSLFD